MSRVFCTPFLSTYPGASLFESRVFLTGWFRAGRPMIVACLVCWLGLRAVQGMFYSEELLRALAKQPVQVIWTGGSAFVSVVGAGFWDGALPVAPPFIQSPVHCS